MPQDRATAAPRPPRRLLVIANPISGGGRAQERVPALCRELADRDIEAEAFFTTRAGDGAERARAAADESWDGLIAAGGDGTINEVLNGMPDPSRPLGFLPVGTANVLALELGLPADPRHAADTIEDGYLQRHPIGECDGRRFLLFVGAGVDGAVVERLSQVRTGTLGKHKWLAPILHIVRRWPRYDLAAELADGTQLKNLSSVLVTRVRNYGGVVRLAEGIDPRDDLLHVHAFRMKSRTAWIWQGLRAFCGRLRAGRALTIHPTRGVTIQGRAPYHLDGDHGGHSPITIGLATTAAQLYAPRPAGNARPR